MHHEIESAEIAIDPCEHRSNVGVGADITREDERRFEPLRQLVHMLFEPALIRECEAGAAQRGDLSNRPRDGSLVRDADDEPVFSGEVRQERLPTALAAAARARAASLTWTAGAAALSRSVALALPLRPATLARTTLSTEARLA